MEVRKARWLQGTFGRDKGQLSLSRYGAYSWTGRPRTLGTKSSGERCGHASLSGPPAEVGTVGLIGDCIPGRAKIMEPSLQGPEVGKVPTKLLEVWSPLSSCHLLCLLTQGSPASWVIGMTAVGEVRGGSVPISGPRLQGRAATESRHPAQHCAGLHNISWLNLGSSTWYPRESVTQIRHRSLEITLKVHRQALF